MFPYGQLSKPAPSMRTRILKALALGPCNGQGELAARVLGSNYTIDQQATFNEAMRSLLATPAEINELKRQLPGTGMAGPPVFEYIYRLL